MLILFTSANQLTLLAHTHRISSMPSLETIENAIKLNTLIVQGLPVGQCSLLQLPHVTEELLYQLCNRKPSVHSLQQFVQLEDPQRRRILCQLTDQQYDDVMNYLSHL